MTLSYEFTSPSEAPLTHVRDFADADRRETSRRLFITTKLANKALEGVDLGEDLAELGA